MSFVVAADANEQFLKSVRDGDHKTVERMIEDQAIDPSMKDNEPLKIAVKQRDKKMIDALMDTIRLDYSGKHVDPYAVSPEEVHHSTEWHVNRGIFMLQEQEKMSQIRESAGKDDKFNTHIQKDRDDGNELAVAFLTAVSKGDQQSVWYLLSQHDDLDPSMHDNAAINKAVANADDTMVWELMKYKGRGVEFSGDKSKLSGHMKWELNK